MNPTSPLTEAVLSTSSPWNSALIASSTRRRAPITSAHGHAPVISFDLGIRRVIPAFAAASTLESIIEIYREAMTHLSSKLGSDIKTWRSLRLTDLSPPHQMRVYKICPEAKHQPALGAITTHEDQVRYVILFKRSIDKVSGYILLTESRVE